MGDEPKIRTLRLPQPAGPVPANKVRFVCVADTQSLTDELGFPVPDGDVLLHAGDFTEYGTCQEVKEFNAWLGTLKHRHKIVVAGNHDQALYCKYRRDQRLKAIKDPAIRKRAQKYFDAEVDPLSLLTNCTYLQDSLVTVFGWTIYGTPWSPCNPASKNRAFCLERGMESLEKWKRIPTGVDILLSHGPPYGIGDKVAAGQRVGCKDLLKEIQTRIRPLYHVYGHIHEDYGVRTDGRTVFINAATCTEDNHPDHAPIVFDLPLPDGVTKEKFIATECPAGKARRSDYCAFCCTRRWGH